MALLTLSVYMLYLQLDKEAMSFKAAIGEMNMMSRKNEGFNQDRNADAIKSKSRNSEMNYEIRETSQSQELHYANHALTFLLFMAHKSASHQHVRLCLLARCLHHLMNLREFLPEGKLNLTVSALYHQLQGKYEMALSPAERWVQGVLRQMVKYFIRKRSMRLWKITEGSLHFISEKQTRKKVYMAHWLNEQTDLIRQFAGAYRKESLFENRIPIPEDEAA